SIGWECCRKVRSQYGSRDRALERQGFLLLLQHAQLRPQADFNRLQFFTPSSKIITSRTFTCGSLRICSEFFEILDLLLCRRQFPLKYRETHLQVGTSQ